MSDLMDDELKDDMDEGTGTDPISTNDTDDVVFGDDDDIDIIDIGTKHHKRTIDGDLIITGDDEDDDDDDGITPGSGTGDEINQSVYKDAIGGGLGIVDTESEDD